MSNHAHRRPATNPDEHAGDDAGFFRRLFGLGKPRQRTDPAAVHFASSRFDAELMAGYLRSNGVQAVVSADDEGGLAPFLQTGQRVRVLVPRGQHAEARKLIDKD